MSSVAPDITQKYREQIFEEQVRILYNQIPTMLLGNLLLTTATVATLWGSIAAETLITWLLLNHTITALRYLLVRHYFRNESNAREAGRWGFYAVVSSALIGSLWGAAGVLFIVPEEPMLAAFICIMMTGIVASATVSQSSYIAAHIVLTVTMLTPLVARLMMEDETAYEILGWTTLFLMLALVKYGHTLQSNLRESLALRFENIGLLKEITLKKEEAERANSAKTRFMAAASHDLRQPLHALGLFIGALEHTSKTAEERGIIENIRASAHATEELLDAMLDISKIDASVIHPVIGPVSLQPLFEKLEREYSALARQRGLSLRIVPTTLIVESDPTMLERILRNLISNSLRYTSHGGALLGCRKRGADARIEVYDTGIGIPADKIDAIFQEFYQLHNPERDSRKGLGLGLTIVERLAQLLGHHLEVRSTVGRGSRFSIELPSLPSPHPVIMAPDPPGTEHLDGIFVLLFDDDATILTATERLLRRWGCDVAATGSLEEALRKVSERTPEVILCDYRLPGGQNGIEVIKRLQRHGGSAIAGIIITGDTAPERLRECQAAGYPVLHKPVRPARLRALLSHVCHEKGARSAASTTAIREP